jgi:adenine phosphoribosyltransferase
LGVELGDLIRSIPDFPKKGILFRDITTLLKDGQGWRRAVDAIYEKYKDARIDKVVSIEARGFLLGGALAYKFGCGIVPLRKPGKLPWEKLSESYELEYGTATIEMHKDAIDKGDRVLIVDDLLATGGTAKAAANLVERQGGEIVGIAFLIRLTDLKGEELLQNYEVSSVIDY